MEEIKKLEITLKETQAQESKIKEAVARLEEETVERQARKDAIKDQLPHLLARDYLESAGESSSEVTKLKGELTEIEEFLNNAVFLISRGLTQVQRELNQRMEITGRGLRRHRTEEQYLELRDQLENDFDKVEAGRLRQLASDIGPACTEETAVLLHKLEDEWRNRPLSEH